MTKYTFWELADMRSALNSYIRGKQEYKKKGEDGLLSLQYNKSHFEEEYYKWSCKYYQDQIDETNAEIDKLINLLMKIRKDQKAQLNIEDCENESVGV